MYKRRRRQINLIDAYVLSGFYSSMLLPNGEYKANAPSIPRRYDDGLEVDDSEEEMLFTICYRGRAPILDGTQHESGEKELPKLTAKRKLAVFRARSKVERDGWCWAINSEINRILGSSAVIEREEQLRETGGLVGK